MSITRGLEYLFLDLTSAYGTSWWRVLASWLVVTFMGTTFLFLKKGVESTKQRRNLEYAILCAFFSVAAFTTIGFDSLGKSKLKDGFKILAVFLSVVGALLIALFLAVFARSFMR